MIGKRFGRLTVISFAYSRDAYYWNCRCDCGGTNIVRTALLNNGSVGSCGCGSLEAARNNSRTASIKKRSKYWPHTKTFKTLHRNMVRRCSNPCDSHYYTYGGRGISVCAEWLNRKTFCDWLLQNNWRPGLSVERINVNGNYEPSNCCLIPVSEQQSNTTRSHFLEWDGKRMTISQWARFIGVRQMALQHRIDRGWTVERALTQPFRRPIRSR